MGTALALLTTFVVGWILFNLVGAFIVGLIARAIFPGKDKVGWLATIGIGFLGGILGKLVFWLLRWPTGFPMGFVASVAGAFVLLYVYHLRVTRRAAASG
jgi:uncharacterized membrane protein YeaQ/YmgE (transglycosylase-associated protein family)